MAVESPQVGDETLDDMVAALREELGADFDLLALVAEERIRTVRGLDDFWVRAWDQYRAEDLPLDQWRALVAARWSRPWSIEGDYRCVRFGWQGQNAMRLALGTIECRRRMLRDIEREQWRLPPDQRCAQTAAMAELFRARDIMRLREIRDVVLADLDKAHALLVRLRQDVASDRRFRSKVGLTSRTTGEIVGPETQINRFGLAVVECRRRLCADAERAKRPPERPVGGRTPRSKDDGHPAQQPDPETARQRDTRRPGSMPSALPQAYRTDGDIELDTACRCVWGEGGRRAREGHDLVSADAPYASQALASKTTGRLDEPRLADPEAAREAVAQSESSPKGANATSSPAAAASSDAGGRSASGRLPADERITRRRDMAAGEADDARPAAGAASHVERPKRSAPDDRDAFAIADAADALQPHDPDADLQAADATPARPFVPNALTDAEQAQIIAYFQRLDEATRNAIFDEAVKQDVLRLLEPGGHPIRPAGPKTRRIDWNDANDTILAYFLREEFQYRNINWRAPPHPP